MNLKILTERKESFGHNYNWNIKEELKILFFQLKAKGNSLNILTHVHDVLCPYSGVLRNYPLEFC